MSPIIALVSVAIGIQIGLLLSRAGVALFRPRWWVCFNARTKHAWIERTFIGITPAAVLFDKSGKVGVIGPFDTAEIANRRCDKLEQAIARDAERRKSRTAQSAA